MLHRLEELTSSSEPQAARPNLLKAVGEVQDGVAESQIRVL